MAEGEQSPAPETEGAGTDEGADGGDQELLDLSSVPEELRDHVQEALKPVQGNVTKKFQEAAQYRQQWEPYEQMGVTDYPPEQLQQLFDFAEMAQDEDAFRDWYYQVGKDMDLLDTGEGDDEDLDTEGLEDLDPEQIQKLVADAVAEKVNPLYETFSRQEQEQLLAVEEQRVGEQVDQILADNPNLPEGARDSILRFAYSYEDEDVTDPIAKGFEDYGAVLAAGEKGLFSKKSSQPPPAEGPGAASTEPEKITSFAQASEVARERLRQSANA